MDSGTQGQSTRLAKTILLLSYRIARAGVYLAAGMGCCLFLLAFVFHPFLSDKSGMIVFLILIPAFVVFSCGSLGLALKPLRTRLRGLGFEAMAASQPWILSHYIGRDLFRDPPSRLRECLANPNESDDYRFIKAWWEAETLDGRGPSPRALAGVLRKALARGELPRTRTGNIKDRKRLWHVLPLILWMLFALIYLLYRETGRPPLDLVFLPVPLLALASIALLSVTHYWIVARRLGYSVGWIDVLRISFFSSGGWLWLPPREAWIRGGIIPPRTREDYKRLLSRWFFVVQRYRRRALNRVSHH
jgi:hypothetical protein